MLLDKLSTDIADQFRLAGLPVETVEVLPSQRDDLGHFQINSAMTLAKTLRKQPREIAGVC